MELVEFISEDHCVSRARPTCRITFRPLKVSRSFDNKSFVLVLRVRGEEYVSPPICVKSKRKRARSPPIAPREAKKLREIHADIRGNADILREILREVKEIKENLREQAFKYDKPTLPELAEDARTSFFDIIDGKMSMLEW